jgi:hypothetical protein
MMRMRLPAVWARMLWRLGLFGLCGGGLDGGDRDERVREQGADTRDVVGACRAGEQAVARNAVEALWQQMHQEAADELVRIEHHHPVSLPTFEAVILPFEGDAFVVEHDQAAVRDSDAMGVAGKIAQCFRGSTEWAFAVDHPLRLRSGAKYAAKACARVSSACLPKDCSCPAR